MITFIFAVINYRRGEEKKLEPRFVGNIVVDIKGLARVIKPLILRLKRKASTCLGPGSALGSGGGGGGKKEEKNGRRRKPNRGASREVVWGGEIKG